MTLPKLPFPITFSKSKESTERGWPCVTIMLSCRPKTQVCAAYGAGSVRDLDIDLTGAVGNFIPLVGGALNECGCVEKWKRGGLGD